MFSEFFYTLLSGDITRSTTCEDLFSCGDQVIWFNLCNVFHHPPKTLTCTLTEGHTVLQVQYVPGVRPPTWGVMQDTVFWKPSTFHLNTPPMPVLGKERFVCYQTGNVPLWSAPCPQGYPLGGGQSVPFWGVDLYISVPMGSFGFTA